MYAGLKLSIDAGVEVNETYANSISSACAVVDGKLPDEKPLEPEFVTNWSIQLDDASEDTSTRVIESASSEFADVYVTVNVPLEALTLAVKHAAIRPDGCGDITSLL
jgi:hypothetical protein